MQDTKAYNEGQQAYEQGLLLSNCPYPKNSLNALDWEEGFLDTEDEDLYED